MDKLKPCPFCGGNPVTSSLRTIVECFCLAQPAIEAHTPHDAAEEWNTRADSAELTAANARIAELERVNAIMDEELRTKTQVLFNLEQDNEHLLEVNGQLQKKAGDIEQGLRDCLNALRMASRGRCPAARRAFTLLEPE